MQERLQESEEHFSMRWVKLGWLLLNGEIIWGGNYR